MLFTDTDQSARLFLQCLLLELDLPSDLDALDRRVAEDPAFLGEIKAKASAYLNRRKPLTNPRRPTHG